MRPPRLHAMIWPPEAPGGTSISQRPGGGVVATKAENMSSRAFLNVGTEGALQRMRTRVACGATAGVVSVHLTLHLLAIQEHGSGHEKALPVNMSSLPRLHWDRLPADRSGHR